MAKPGKCWGYWPRNINFFQGVFFSPWGDSAAHHRAGIFHLHWLSLLHFTINHIYNNIWNNLQCNQLLYVTFNDVCYCYVWFCCQLISRFFIWVSGLDFSINKICIKLEYTIRSIVCEASCHLVTQSFSLLIIWSFSHSVIQSLGHSVTWSLGHFVTLPLCHYFQHWHGLTHNIRI